MSLDLVISTITTDFFSLYFYSFHEIEQLKNEPRKAPKCFNHKMCVETSNETLHNRPDSDSHSFFIGLHLHKIRTSAFDPVINFILVIFYIISMC